jgi:hypothetical protein
LRCDVEGEVENLHNPRLAAAPPEHSGSRNGRRHPMLDGQRAELGPDGAQRHGLQPKGGRERDAPDLAVHAFAATPSRERQRLVERPHLDIVQVGRVRSGQGEGQRVDQHGLHKRMRHLIQGSLELFQGLLRIKEEQARQVRARSCHGDGARLGHVLAGDLEQRSKALEEVHHLRRPGVSRQGAAQQRNGLCPFIVRSQGGGRHFTSDPGF